MAKDNKPKVKKPKNPLKAIKRDHILSSLEAALAQRKEVVIAGKKRVAHQGRFDIKYEKERMPLLDIMRRAWLTALSDDTLSELPRSSPEDLKKRAKKLGFKVKKSAFEKRRLAKSTLTELVGVMGQNAPVERLVPKSPPLFNKEGNSFH